MNLENINPKPQLSLFEENNILIQKAVNEALKGLLYAISVGEVKYSVKDIFVLAQLNKELNTKKIQDEVIYIGFEELENLDVEGNNEI
jgi:hypothetical protein